MESEKEARLSELQTRREGHMKRIASLQEARETERIEATRKREELVNKIRPTPGYFRHPEIRIILLIKELQYFKKLDYHLKSDFSRVETKSDRY